ncbi:hypothetical protein [Vermiculatibacterium agrestimuris]|nr:hypothetical protein [Vermiculatibacterium agrestimuris]
MPRGGAAVEEKTLPTRGGGEKGDVDDLIFSAPPTAVPSDR